MKRTGSRPRSRPRGQRASGRGRKTGPLDEYRRRRDFARTPEPAGRTRRRRGGLAFVIQKHDATRLHYDLRLEVDGVMKSWAVPKGPSLDPKVRRLAVQVEDHPIEYNRFEGTIPRGEYGAGTVMLWDRGTYEPDVERTGRSPEDVMRRMLRDGRIRIVLHGDRLRGSFTLVRTGAGTDGKPKWLLIKRRDEHASRTDVTRRYVTSVATGRTLDEIAAAGDGPPDGRRSASLTAGPSAPPAPARPTPARSVPEDPPAWTFEPWSGGEHVLAFAAADGARIVDSRGRDATRRHPGVATELADLARRIGHGFVVEGERRDDGRVLAITDLLVDGEANVADRPWTQRRRRLDALLRRRRLDRIRRVERFEDADAALARAARDGWPGVVARRRDATYHPGERTGDILRVTIPRPRGGR